MTQPTSPPWGDPSPSPGDAHGRPYGQVDDAPSSPYLGGPGHAPASGYVTPHTYGGYAAPAAPTTPMLGRVALIAGIVALVGSIVNALIIASLFRPEMFDSPDGGNVAMLMSLGLANVLLVWFGFGLWAIIQGGIAIAQRRGVGPGIGGVILGIVGPWVGVVIAGVAFVSAFANV